MIFFDEQHKVRFLKSFEVTSTGCWNHKGKPRDGYPQVSSRFGGKKYTYTASRISWQIHYGDIPEGLSVLHRCDNTLCVNPTHLFLGTHKDNMHDMVRKGRSKRLKDNKELLSKMIELAHTEEAYLKRKLSHEKIKFQQGSNNSQFGKNFYFINNGNIIKKIEVQLLPQFLKDGWVRGRKLG